MEFTPTLLWSQTNQNIEIEINLPNISNEIYNSENNIFHFECLSSNKKYSIDFELEMEVTKSNITFKNDKKIVIDLIKKEEGEKWNFLTKKRGLYKNNIKINWDKWENSDDEEEDDENESNQQEEKKEVVDDKKEQQKTGRGRKAVAKK